MIYCESGEKCSEYCTTLRIMMYVYMYIYNFDIIGDAQLRDI